MDIEFIPVLQRTIWGPAILFNAILFPKTFYYSYTARSATFLTIAASVAWALQPHDFNTPSTSYLFGFAPCWSLIVAAVLLLLCNPTRDFRRIRRKIVIPSNGWTEDSKLDPPYEWEAFPEQFSGRFWWTFDLLMNWRGLGWSYQKRQHQIPDEVKRVYDESGINVVRDGCPSDVKKPESRSSFLARQCKLFMIDYILLDFTIYLMDRDPWFNRPLRSDERLLFGYPSGNLDILVVPYRVLVGTLATYSVMDIAHVTLAFVSVGLGERWLGTHGEPWMHPRLWGSLTELFHRGLPGFWGTFWHDLFRFQFLTIARKLIPNPQSNKKNHNSLRAFLYMTLVFALSGSMHAAGSYTVLRKTDPLWLFAGFTVQPVGVALQEIITAYLAKMGIGPRVIHFFVICFWFGWGWLTAPMVIGDMAACGLFQSKVIPFHIFNSQTLKR